MPVETWKPHHLEDFCIGTPGWLSQLSVQLWLRSQFVGSSPASGSVLTAQSLEPASDSVSPSFSAPPPLALSLSKINKTFLKIKKRLVYKRYNVINVTLLLPS